MSEILTNFHFIRPLWLLAALPAVGTWILLVRAEDPRREFEEQFPPHLLDALLVQPKERSTLRPTTLLLALWLIGALALAGPSWQMEPEPFAEDQAGLYIIARLAPSIELEDVQPSRLERSRHKVNDLLELRKGGKTGLIAYSGSAHLVMPLTADATVIEQMFESLSPKIMPTEGDVLSEALRLASVRIADNGQAASILVIADSVEAAQLEPLKQWRSEQSIAVQILAPLPTETSTESTGIQQAANVLNATVHRLTPDEADVTAIQRRATSAIVSAGGEGGARWRDEGWWLTPLLVLGALFWGRAGWSIPIR